jgi:CDP-4-dehydro-6-deoxyglucose reductase
MGFKISVQPSQHVFQAAADESILDAALRHGLMMPYGCRDGMCGACRGKVLSGEVRHGRASHDTLNDADRDAGYALFCCASAQSDLLIESREIRSTAEIPVRTLPVRVEQLTLAAPDVMLVDLKLPPGERLQFLAGQYVEILLKAGRRRAFSLANAPHDDSYLQLHVRRVPGGVFTEQVFTTMKARDMLRISGPHGSFFLREESAKPILMVAGGTGFAPLKAMVEHALADPAMLALRPITLYWGGRSRADLYMAERAASWAEKYANIKFVPVLSEPAENDAWQGRTGFVHAAAMQDFADLSGHQVYVCGSPAMVAAARRDFIGQCALPDNEFFADSFEFANDATGSPVR